MQVRTAFRPGPESVYRIGFAAHTMFVTGNAAAFTAEANELRTMTLEAGREIKERDGRYHFCVELGNHSVTPWFRRKRRYPTEVHIQYCPRWKAF